MPISFDPAFDAKYKKLVAIAKSLKIPEEDIPFLIPNVERLSNIVIESYLRSKNLGKKK